MTGNGDSILIREITDSDLDGLLELYMQLHDNPFPAKDDRLAEIWNDILSDKHHLYPQ